MDVELPEDLCRIKEMLVLENPTVRTNVRRTSTQQSVCYISVLLCVVSHERQVQENGKPVSVDHEEEGQDGMYGGFGDDVGVEAIAQIDRVNIITTIRELISRCLISLFAGMLSVMC